MSTFSAYCYTLTGMTVTLLDELRAITTQLRNYEALVITRDRLILAARQDGAPWAQIADALGVTTQAAQNMGQRAQKRLGMKNGSQS